MTAVPFTCASLCIAQQNTNLLIPEAIANCCVLAELFPTEIPLCSDD